MRKESNVVEMAGRAGLVRTKTEAAAVLPDRGSEGKEQRTYRKRCREFPGRKLRTEGTQIVASAEAKQAMEPRQGATADVDVAMYRKYTEALLRRYQRLKLQAGRVPSRIDREMFRGRMSHYKVEGFDDAVIFCTDVERCLQRLNASDERLLRRIAVQEYSMGEAAGVLGMSLRSCIVLYWRGRRDMLSGDGRLLL